MGYTEHYWKEKQAVAVRRQRLLYKLVQTSSNKMATMSEEVLEDVKERFDMYDKKGDGKVEAHQLVDVLRACDLNPLTSEVEKIIKDSDLANKRVDVETFCGIYEQIKNAPGQATFEDMMEAFKTFDRDNAGSLSSGQLRQLLVNIGDTLSEPHADLIVKKYEDQDTGMIFYQDMLKSLLLP